MLIARFGFIACLILALEGCAAGPSNSSHTAVSTQLQGSDRTSNSPPEIPDPNSPADIACPQQPTDFSIVSPNPTQAMLFWKDAGASATKYVIRQSNDNGATWVVVDVVPPHSEADTISNLTPGKTYQFSVTAYTTVSPVPATGTSDSSSRPSPAQTSTSRHPAN
jgi:Fibronectin type III domain